MKRARVALLIVASVFGARAVACSSFSAAPSPVDRQNDASAAERGTAITDGAVDAPGAGSFCAARVPTPTFCADFDGDNPFAGWDGPLTQGIVYEASTDTFHSPSRALYSALQVATGRHGGLSRSLAKTEHFRFGYSLYIDERPKDGPFEVNIVRLALTPKSHDLYLEIDESGATYYEQLLGFADAGTFIPTALTQPLAAKTWQRIVLEIDLVASTLRVTVNDVEAGTATLNSTYADSLQLNAGITYSVDSTNGGSVFVDDMVFESLD